MNDLVIGVVGNPNCGKTTLFNALTGARQRVGNWPGVTVDRKIGDYTHAGRKVSVVDLPGIYSLSAASLDEAALYGEISGRCAALKLLESDTWVSDVLAPDIIHRRDTLLEKIETEEDEEADILGAMYLTFMITINIGGAFIDFFDIFFGTLFVDGRGVLLAAFGSLEWFQAIIASGHRICRPHRPDPEKHPAPGRDHTLCDGTAAPTTGRPFAASCCGPGNACRPSFSGQAK